MNIFEEERHLPQTLIYKRGPLALDLWTPKGTARGLLIYAHGGSFLYGSRSDRLTRHFGPLFAASGIAFASIDYRKGQVPARAFAPEEHAAIEAAQSQSADFYPSVRPDLLGKAMYRASIDFARACQFLRSYQDGVFAHLPWIAMGNSAGGLAAICATHPPKDMPKLPDLPRPGRVIAIASLVPQPWSIRQDGPPINLLVARGDQVFPRNEVNRLEERANSDSLPVEISRIHYGQHSRPIRELIEGHQTDGTSWSQWLFDLVEQGLRANE